VETILLQFFECVADGGCFFFFVFFFRFVSFLFGFTKPPGGGGVCVVLFSFPSIMTI